MSERDVDVMNENYQEWLFKIEELSHIRVESPLSDEYTIVKSLFSNKYLSSELESWLKCLKRKHYKEKSETLADEWKLKGNKYFDTKEYFQAVSCYSNCIKIASRSSVTFAYGLSNRASAFIEMEKFENAHKDIDLLFALKTYPAHNIHKLYLKQAKCYVSLGECEKGKFAYEKALEHLLNQSKQSPIDIGIIKKKLSDLDCHIKHTKTKYNKNQISVLPKLESEYPFLPGVSNKLLLKYSKEKGRHIVSKTEIKKGELLFVEKPFVFVPIIDENKSFKMCNKCGLVSDYFLVCEECCDTYYCSEDCRIEAWKKFHCWECEGSKMSIWYITGIAHLTFRVVLAAFENLCSKNLLEQNCPSILSNMGNVEHFNCNYSRVFHLVSNHGKITEKELKKYTITSIMLTIYLKNHTKFFEEFLERKEIKISPKETQLLISCLLYKHILQMIPNASLITSNSENTEMVGVGLYPASSMMNHSCMPNTKNRYYRNVFIVRASRNIKAGSEVYNCYGPQVRHGNTDERRALLKEQYIFDCECEACLSNL